MKITKSQLKQIIKEEIKSALERGAAGKPEKTRDEKIWTRATQIVSTTKTSGDLKTIARIANDILELVAGPGVREEGTTRTGRL